MSGICRITIACVFILATGVHLPTVVAQSDQGQVVAKNQFREFCRSKVAAVQEVYRNLSCEVRVIEERGATDRQASVTSLCHDGEFMLARLGSLKISDGGSIPSFAETGALAEDSLNRLISIRNAKYFALVGRDQQGQSVLRTISPSSESGLWHDSVPYALPFSRSPVAWIDISNDARTIVTGGKRTDDLNGRSTETYTIVCYLPSRVSEQTGFCKCDATFESRTGVCTEVVYTFEKLPKVISRVHIEYEWPENLNDVPVLSRTEIVIEGDAIPYRETREFRSLMFDPEIPEERCWLAYYGLPEPPEPQPPTAVRIPAWLWALMAGVVLFGASIFLRRRSA